jgi:hypothetical protein
MRIVFDDQELITQKWWNGKGKDRRKELKNRCKAINQQRTYL